MNEIRAGVMEGASQETMASEATLCGLVQHEVAQQLALLESPLERTAAVEQAARDAILGVFGSDLPFHSFCVAQATRGVLHGLVCVGLDISYVAAPALRGVHHALTQVDLWTPDNEAGMREGMREALEDLGITRLADDHALDLPEFYREQTAVFGKSFY